MPNGPSVDRIGLACCWHSNVGPSLPLPGRIRSVGPRLRRRASVHSSSLLLFTRSRIDFAWAALRGTGRPPPGSPSASLSEVLPYGTVHTAPRPCSCQANGYDIGLSFDSRRVRRTLSDRTTSQNTLATVNQPKPWLSGVTLAVVTVAWSLASDAGHGKGRYGVVDARPQGGTRHSLNRQGVGKQSKQEPSNT